jgi:hypothetical protein
MSQRGLRISQFKLRWNHQSTTVIDNYYSRPCASELGSRLDNLDLPPMPISPKKPVQATGDNAYSTIQHEGESEGSYLQDIEGLLGNVGFDLAEL